MQASQSTQLFDPSIPATVFSRDPMPGSRLLSEDANGHSDDDVNIYLPNDHGQNSVIVDDFHFEVPDVPEEFIPYQSRMYGVIEAGTRRRRLEEEDARQEEQAARFNQMDAAGAGASRGVDLDRENATIFPEYDLAQLESALTVQPTPLPFPSQVNPEDIPSFSDEAPDIAALEEVLFPEGWRSADYPAFPDGDDYFVDPSDSFMDRLCDF